MCLCLLLLLSVECYVVVVDVFVSLFVVCRRSPVACWYFIIVVVTFVSMIYVTSPVFPISQSPIVSRRLFSQV